MAAKDTHLLLADDHKTSHHRKMSLRNSGKKADGTSSLKCNSSIVVDSSTDLMKDRGLSVGGRPVRVRFKPDMPQRQGYLVSRSTSSHVYIYMCTKSTRVDYLILGCARHLLMRPTRYDSLAGKPTCTPEEGRQLWNSCS